MSPNRDFCPACDGGRWAHRARIRSRKEMKRVDLYPAVIKFRARPPVGRICRKSAGRHQVLRRSSAGGMAVRPPPGGPAVFGVRTVCARIVTVPGLGYMQVTDVARSDVGVADQEANIVGIHRLHQIAFGRGLALRLLSRSILRNPDNRENPLLCRSARNSGNRTGSRRSAFSIISTTSFGTP
jgi:hypothetical protein